MGEQFSIHTYSQAVVAQLVEIVTRGRAGHRRRRRAALARRVGAVLGKRGYTAGEIHQFWRDCVDVAALELASAE